MVLESLQVEFNQRMTVAQKVTAESFLRELKSITATDMDDYNKELFGKNVLDFLNAVLVRDDGSPLAIGGIDWIPVADVLIVIDAYLDAHDQSNQQSALLESIKAKTQNV